MIVDSIVLEEMTIDADKSYLRFDASEWYKYERGNISFIRNPDWLESMYQDAKNFS